jgi:toxin YoeB
MEIEFKTGALDDIEFWKRSGNKKIQNRISALLKSIASTPESGIGKPEKLKGNLSGFWSRRINLEHRIIYKFDYPTQIATIYSLKGHYD